MFLSSGWILFSFGICLSVFLVVSSPSLIFCWVALELSTLIFIPFILRSHLKSLRDAAIKYFLTQSLGSALFVVGVVASSLASVPEDIETTASMVGEAVVSISLLIKVGAAPFHIWLPRIVESLGWLELFLLLTVQKINPLIILSKCSQNQTIILVVIVASVLVGGIGGLPQTRLRRILAFSSINHVGWILCAFMYGLKLGVLYFASYAVILWTILLVFSKFNLQHINQLSSLSIPPVFAIISLLNLLSLGGLPPFFGFFPKWIVLQASISSEGTLISLIIVFSRLMVLYFYLRVTVSAFVISKIAFLLANPPRITILFILLNVVSLGGLAFSFIM